MRRLGLAIGAAALLAACSSPLLPRADVPDLVRDAFHSAGLQAERVSVDPTRDGDSWNATAEVDGTDVALIVDAEAGRITRIDLGASSSISRDELREVARYESNPANERARARRRVGTFVVASVLVAGGLLVARQLRLREERERADNDEEQ